MSVLAYRDVLIVANVEQSKLGKSTIPSPPVTLIHTSPLAPPISCPVISHPSGGSLILFHVTILSLPIHLRHTVINITYNGPSPTTLCLALRILPCFTVILLPSTDLFPQ